MGVFDGKRHQIKDEQFVLENNARGSKGRPILISNKAIENSFVCRLLNFVITVCNAYVYSMYPTENAALIINSLKDRTFITCH